MKNRNFARYEILGEILIGILVSTLDYFQKQLIKFFKKSKKTHFGVILGPFSPNLSKIEFSWKNGLCQFLNNPIIYHRAKNQEKK